MKQVRVRFYWEFGTRCQSEDVWLDAKGDFYDSKGVKLLCEVVAFEFV